MPVEGTVTFDGQPVSRATVMFVTDGEDLGQIQPTSSTNSEGRFSLRTKADVGALPGKYKVAVSKVLIAPRGAPGTEPPEAATTLMPPGGVRVMQQLPAIYARPQTTPVRVEVPKGGKKDVEISLSSKPQPQSPERKD